ncbi:MAG: 3-deoxy-D-manno-octulosonic acid transferase, partial [Planctomycetes bacterium]|nr:3-deoxy-D-manno-octulosonic acid transferase [Planctomycetota bacterium]
RRGVPVVVVNGRLTERSMRRLQRLGRFARTMFADLTWVGAQDSTIAGRFRALGVPEERVEITSSMKWDTAAVADRIDGAEELAQALGIPRDRPLWVCGSTGPGEEALILGAFHQVLQDWPTLAQSVQGESGEGGGFGPPALAVVPRKPERFDEVADLIGRLGFSVVRRSECDGEAAGARIPESAVFLGDTMGELRKFYSLADVVFVGRSLVPMGGSDPMEVAALGKPIIVGPHMENFRLPVDALAGADAIRVVASADALPATVEGILTDPALASGLGARAKDVVARHQGATGRTTDAIVQVLATY